MKAAILKSLGTAPVYGEIEAPRVQGAEQSMIEVLAASVKNLDKMRAAGKHYANYADFPTTVGIDGVGRLEDGRVVYAVGLTGMIAEQAIVAAHRYTPLPENIDYALAAALPNAVLGSALALKRRTHFVEGMRVLVNGATGVTGQVAVQVARELGAVDILATGRNETNLQKLLSLGATSVLSLKKSDDEIVATLREEHAKRAFDIVLDYTWGHPVELILQALASKGLQASSHRVRIVTIGSMAGDSANLHSASLRSSALEVCGSGFGSLSDADLSYFNRELLPHMFELAAHGHLQLDVHRESLENVEVAWTATVESGKRLVIEINK